MRWPPLLPPAAAEPPAEAEPPDFCAPADAPPDAEPLAAEPLDDEPLAAGLFEPELAGDEADGLWLCVSCFCLSCATALNDSIAAATAAAMTLNLMKAPFLWMDSVDYREQPSKVYA
jgi:hypothetical protein